MPGPLVDDSALRARVSGRERVAQNTIWSLTVRELRFRCIATAGDYVIQVRHSTGWKELIPGADPMVLLRRAATSGSVRRAIAMAKEDR